MLSDRTGSTACHIRFHSIPGGLWEMSIGVWLIAKGFNSSAFVSQPEDTGQEIVQTKF